MAKKPLPPATTAPGPPAAQTTPLPAAAPSLPAPASPATAPASAAASSGQPNAAVFTFPNIVNALGLIGVLAVSAAPLAMVMTARQLDLLYHLGFSTTWYITSLLPRSFMFARLGAILVGLTALWCLGFFLVELLWVSFVESRYKIGDKSSRREKVRYNALLIIPSCLIVILSTATVRRGALDLVAGFIVGFLLGAAMGLTTIPAQDLGCAGA
jgi:hypothetical protein